MLKTSKSQLKTFPVFTTPGLDDFIGKFPATLKKEKKAIVHRDRQIKEFFSSSYGINISLIPKCGKDTTRKTDGNEESGREREGKKKETVG